MKIKRSKEWWQNKAASEPDGSCTAGLPDRPFGASSQCPHSDLHFHLNNACIGDTTLHYLEITAKCKTCAADMVFPGVPMGSSPHNPACSPDGKELRVPFLGEFDDMTGKPIGFIIRSEGFAP